MQENAIEQNVFFPKKKIDARDVIVMTPKPEACCVNLKATVPGTVLPVKHTFSDMTLFKSRNFLTLVYSGGKKHSFFLHSSQSMKLEDQEK
jgi:hypothetical protein